MRDDAAEAGGPAAAASNVPGAEGTGGTGPEVAKTPAEEGEKLPNLGRMMEIRVQMLDDSITLFQVQVKAPGRILFDQVCKQLNLLEVDYFGLEYNDSQGVVYWLDLDKQMNHQVGLPSNDPLLRFCVKFYTPDPAQIEEEYTRYLFSLQIKRDLAEGTLQCNDNTAALMASYIVQAECGDYVVEDYPDHTYLSTFKFVPQQDSELERRIMENHKKHTGQSPAEADLNLLETARRCELYGIKMHSAKDHEGVPLNLSVAQSGVLVFQNYTKINTFSWAKVRKLSFKRKRYLIKLHPEGYGYYKDTVEFYFEDRNHCKNFWKKCVEHHTFFRCSTAVHKEREKRRILSRGSSFRYSGKTQKQMQEFVRENFAKRQSFQRNVRNIHSSMGNVGTSLSAQPLLPIGDNGIGQAFSASCGAFETALTSDTGVNGRYSHLQPQHHTLQRFPNSQQMREQASFYHDTDVATNPAPSTMPRQHQSANNTPRRVPTPGDGISFGFAAVGSPYRSNGIQQQRAQMRHGLTEDDDEGQSYVDITREEAANAVRGSIGDAIMVSPKTGKILAFRHSIHGGEAMFGASMDDNASLSLSSARTAGSENRSETTVVEKERRASGASKRSLSGGGTFDRRQRDLMALDADYDEAEGHASSEDNLSHESYDLIEKEGLQIRSRGGSASNTMQKGDRMDQPVSHFEEEFYRTATTAIAQTSSSEHIPGSITLPPQGVVGPANSSTANNSHASLSSSIVTPPPPQALITPSSVSKVLQGQKPPAMLPPEATTIPILKQPIRRKSSSMNPRSSGAQPIPAPVVPPRQSLVEHYDIVRRVPSPQSQLQDFQGHEASLQQVPQTPEERLMVDIVRQRGLQFQPMPPQRQPSPYQHVHRHQHIHHGCHTIPRMPRQSPAGIVASGGHVPPPRFPHQMYREPAPVPVPPPRSGGAAVSLEYASRTLPNRRREKSPVYFSRTGRMMMQADCSSASSSSQTSPKVHQQQLLSRPKSLEFAVVSTSQLPSKSAYSYQDDTLEQPSNPALMEYDDSSSAVSGMNELNYASSSDVPQTPEMTTVQFPGISEAPLLPQKNIYFEERIYDVPEGIEGVHPPEIKTKPMIRQPVMPAENSAKSEQKPVPKSEVEGSQFGNLLAAQQTKQPGLEATQQAHNLPQPQPRIRKSKRGTNEQQQAGSACLGGSHLPPPPRSLLPTMSSTESESALSARSAPTPVGNPDALLHSNKPSMDTEEDLEVYEDIEVEVDDERKDKMSIGLLSPPEESESTAVLETSGNVPAPPEFSSAGGIGEKAGSGNSSDAVESQEDNTDADADDLSHSRKVGGAIPEEEASVKGIEYDEIAQDAPTAEESADQQSRAEEHQAALCTIPTIQEVPEPETPKNSPESSSPPISEVKELKQAGGGRQYIDGSPHDNAMVETAVSEHSGEEGNSSDSPQAGDDMLQDVTTSQDSTVRRRKVTPIIVTTSSPTDQEAKPDTCDEPDDEGSPVKDDEETTAGAGGTLESPPTVFGEEEESTDPNEIIKIADMYVRLGNGSTISSNGDESQTHSNSVPFIDEDAETETTEKLPGDKTDQDAQVQAEHLPLEQRAEHVFIPPAQEKDAAPTLSAQDSQESSEGSLDIASFPPPPIVEEEEDDEEPDGIVIAAGGPAFAKEAAAIAIASELQHHQQQQQQQHNEEEVLEEAAAAAASGVSGFKQRQRVLSRISEHSSSENAGKLPEVAHVPSTSVATAIPGDDEVEEVFEEEDADTVSENNVTTSEDNENNPPSLSSDLPENCAPVGPGQGQLEYGAENNDIDPEEEEEKEKRGAQRSMVMQIVKEIEEGGEIEFPSPPSSLLGNQTECTQMEPDSLFLEITPPEQDPAQSDDTNVAGAVAAPAPEVRKIPYDLSGSSENNMTDPRDNVCCCLEDKECEGCSCEEEADDDDDDGDESEEDEPEDTSLHDSMEILEEVATEDHFERELDDEQPEEQKTPAAVGSQTDVFEMLPMPSDLPPPEPIPAQATPPKKEPPPVPPKKPGKKTIIVTPEVIL